MAGWKALLQNDPMPYLDERTTAMTKTLSLALVLALLATAAFAADEAKDPIRIGEINSYNALPLYTENYRKGWQLAVEEVNAAGGINGRKIVVIDRDDLGNPGDAMRVAQELLLNEKINLLSGCTFGNVCNALGDFAAKNKIFTMRWFGNPDREDRRESDYAFGLISSFGAWTRAPAAYTLEKHPDLRRWASLSPNYAGGHQVVKVFSDYVAMHSPKAKWLDTFWYPIGKLDAAVTIGAIQPQKVDAVYSVTFGSDAARMIRASKQRQFDKNKIIVVPEAGMPEFMKTIGSEMPEGWIMTGYPPEQINTPEHTAFVDKFEKRWGEKPGWMSLNGYNAYQFIFSALRKTSTLKSDDLVKAMEGITADTPLGKLKMRASDHLSTQGIWVGVSHLENNRPMLKDWKYYPGEEFMIDEDKVKPHEKAMEIKPE